MLSSRPSAELDTWNPFTRRTTRESLIPQLGQQESAGVPHPDQIRQSGDA
jgi:hypothetical protein